MSNRRKIDLIKLAAVLDRPPPLTRLPDRRVRACCKTRQGSSHGDGCTRAKDPVQLRASDASRSLVAPLPAGEMKITVRVPE